MVTSQSATRVFSIGRELCHCDEIDMSKEEEEKNSIAAFNIHGTEPN